jgi:NAD(P)-dependent dehydrogenase (short-subunit alcohol dehydrogenase family)
MQDIAAIQRFALVTGSSTGIGKACAVDLARRGFSVLAGVRKAEDGEKLKLIAGANLQAMQLDIADTKSIVDAAAKISELTGNAGLAGLVNNAGIGVPGPIEFLTRDDWRRQFEVNLFGHVELTSALLPALRRHVGAAGAGAARIVFIGSIAGRVSIPILGAYAASKHALAAMAGSLRMELRRQGIHVSLIEPGSIQSEIWKKGDDAAAGIGPDAPPRQLYGPEIDAVLASSRQSAANAIPADRVARVVYECLTSSRPPLRKTVGRDAFFAAMLRRILPEGLFEKVLLMGMKIK